MFRVLEPLFSISTIVNHFSSRKQEPSNGADLRWESKTIEVPPWESCGSARWQPGGNQAPRRKDEARCLTVLASKSE
jgi:hypothetical protein